MEIGTEGFNRLHTQSWERIPVMRSISYRMQSFPFDNCPFGQKLLSDTKEESWVSIIILDYHKLLMIHMLPLQLLQSFLLSAHFIKIQLYLVANFVF